MQFWMIIVILLLISFMAALFGLGKELSKPKEIEHAKRELSRERVIFRAK